MISSKYFLRNGNYSLVSNSNLSNYTNTWNSKLYNFPYRCKHFSLVGTNFESNNVFIHVSKISSTACMDTSLYKYYQGSVFYRSYEEFTFDHNIWNIYRINIIYYIIYYMRHVFIIQNRLTVSNVNVTKFTKPKNWIHTTTIFFWYRIQKFPCQSNYKLNF